MIADDDQQELDRQQQGRRQMYLDSLGNEVFTKCVRLVTLSALRVKAEVVGILVELHTAAAD